MSNPFGAEDFIPFDFDDPGPSTSTHNSPPPSNQTTNPNSRSNSLCPRDGTPSNIRRNQARDSVSSRAAGKKRKLDDRDDDGRSKKEKVQARSRHTPWASDVDWEKCRNGAEMLHREIMAFDRWLAPTRPEHEVRVMVIELIRKAITAQWRDAKVFSFGSQETRLYLPQGDIDLVVVSDAMEYQRREGVLRNMAACLRRNNLATDVTVIARAKVPIVKFVCTYGKLKVDISVNQTNGLEAARFVNGWLDKMICMRPLVMTTKHLLAQRGMSEVFSGGLGSYSVIILVISFLQLHPKIQRGEIDPNRNLGVLFLEFLELYGKYFGYDNCGISIRGKGGYFSKARRGWKDERKPFMLCLEDPQDPTNDISKGSYSIINVRSTLGGAFDILTAAICERANGGAPKQGTHRTFDLNEDERARNEILNDSNTEEKDPNSLLGTILGVSKSMVRQRKDMEDLYHSGVLQYKLGRPAPPSSPPPARSPPPAQTPRGPRASEPSSRKKGQGKEEGERRRSSEKNAKAGGQTGSKIDSKDAKGKAEIVDEQELAQVQGFRLYGKDVGSAIMISSDGEDEASMGSRGRRGGRRSSSTSLVSPSDRGSDQSDDDEDSRYRTGPSGRRNGTKRRKISSTNTIVETLGDISASAPSTYVTESSASGSEDDEARGTANWLRKTLPTAVIHRSSSSRSGSDGCGSAERRVESIDSSGNGIRGPRDERNGGKKRAMRGKREGRDQGPAPTQPKQSKKLSRSDRRAFWTSKGNAGFQGDADSGVLAIYD